MSGSPRRPSLDSFGPQLRDQKPVTNPETQIGADMLNLVRFQLAGLGLTSFRAWALIDSTGGVTPVISARAESWNPNTKTGAPYLPPIPGRTGVGALSLQYASSYPDENGVQQSTSIVCALAFPVNRTTVRDAAASVSGSTISIALKEFGGGTFAAVDGAVLVVIL
ncbi:MAG TPA: hypothetical protein VH062_02165 [Polyangiaceae bacterium]|jgi:hypothetical protein|nr:hypothetical protein [Polyangiaceae bacterium]